MSTSSNPDRIYVSRQFRAKLHLDSGPQQHFPSLPEEVRPLPIGAVLQDISVSGCCLRLPRPDFHFDIRLGQHIPFLKMLHPSLEGSPIEGRVVWFREESTEVLVGIQFTHIQPTTLASILLLLTCNQRSWHRSFSYSEANRARAEKGLCDLSLGTEIGREIT